MKHLFETIQYDLAAVVVCGHKQFLLCGQHPTTAAPSEPSDRATAFFATFSGVFLYAVTKTKETIPVAALCGMSCLQLSGQQYERLLSNISVGYCPVKYAPPPSILRSQNLRKMLQAGLTGRCIRPLLFSLLKQGCRFLNSFMLIMVPFGLSWFGLQVRAALSDFERQYQRRNALRYKKTKVINAHGMIPSGLPVKLAYYFYMFYMFSIFILPAYFCFVNRVFGFFSCTLRQNFSEMI
jgi:hypothetical protein